jgi:N-acetylated-alpha-linked acidic dipeptidase
VAPQHEDPPPFLNFSPLENSAAAFTQAASAYQKALTRIDANGGEKLIDPQVNSVNKTLLTVERAFINPDGLPERPWFRHMIYAPGFYTGYSAKTIPGVREALDKHEWSLAEKEARITSGFIDKAAERVTSAAQELSKIDDSLSTPATPNGKTGR